MVKQDRYSLELRPFTHVGIQGIYGEGGDILPRRMRHLQPSACAALISAAEALKNQLYLSDAWRTAKSSHRRRVTLSGKIRRGVKAPGYSAHNYGLAVDIAVTKTMSRAGLSGKKRLDAIMQDHGWFCHRLDGVRGSEEWHYNYLQHECRIKKGETRTSHAVERIIASRYGSLWSPAPGAAQRYLKALGLYRGALDGIFGRKSKESTRQFQKVWGLSADGVIGRKTGRLLWYRNAEVAYLENLLRT